MDKWTFLCESTGLVRRVCVRDPAPRRLLILRLHLAISQLLSDLPARVFLLQPSEGALLISVWETFFLPLTVFKVSCTLCVSATLHVSLPSFCIRPRCLTKVAERRRFQPLVFKASTSQYPWTSSPSRSCTHLRREAKYEGGPAVTSLSSPLYFQDVSLPALVSSGCVVHLVFLHLWSLVLRVD